MLLVPAMIAAASISQPTPSEGTISCSGAPAAIDLAPRNANDIPIGISPDAAASGEIPIGISFAFRGARSIAAGAPLQLIVPSEGVGWEMEAAAIMAGTSNIEAAQKLIDFSVSMEAMEMYNAAYAVVAIPGVAKPVKHFPEGLLEGMIQNDFEFAANNRARILKEWQSRYDGKSEPKK